MKQRRILLFCMMFAAGFAGTTPCMAKEDRDYRAPGIPIVLSEKEPSASLIGDGESRWYFFCAGETGWYAFFSKGDSDMKGTLYLDDRGFLPVKNDDSGTDRNFRIRCHLKKGESAFLKIQGTKKGTFSYETGVSRTFKVTYDSLGGIGTPLNAFQYEDEPLTISGICPVKPGYQFLGWSRKKDSTIVDYFSWSHYKENQPAVLYAVWKKLS